MFAMINSLLISRDSTQIPEKVREWKPVPELGNLAVTGLIASRDKAKLLNLAAYKCIDFDAEPFYDPETDSIAGAYKCTAQFPDVMSPDGRWVAPETMVFYMDVDAMKILFTQITGQDLEEEAGEEEKPDTAPAGKDPDSPADNFTGGPAT